MLRTAGNNDILEEARKGTSTEHSKSVLTSHFCLQESSEINAYCFQVTHFMVIFLTGPRNSCPFPLKSNHRTTKSFARAYRHCSINALKSKHGGKKMITHSFKKDFCNIYYISGICSITVNPNKPISLNMSTNALIYLPFTPMVLLRSEKREQIGEGQYERFFISGQ